MNNLKSVSYTHLDVYKRQTQGTVTDAEGNYSLSNVAVNATLVFSFVGMETQEINVGNRTRIDVTLQEEAIALQEVVAVGYGLSLIHISSVSILLICVMQVYWDESVWRGCLPL